MGCVRGSTDQSYGDEWADGDVIGCCLDLEDKTVSFFRNGASMGVAYRGIQQTVYYPAVSLSSGERCEVNFGEQPFFYPIEGYSPLVKPPAENAAATFVFTSLYRCGTVDVLSLFGRILVEDLHNVVEDDGLNVQISQGACLGRIFQKISSRHCVSVGGGTKTFKPLRIISQDGLNQGYP